MRPDCLDERVRVGQIFAGRAIAFDQVIRRRQPEAIDTEIEPKVKDRQHLADDRGVVEIEVRLMKKNAVPVVGLRVDSERSNWTWDPVAYKPRKSPTPSALPSEKDG